MHHDYDISLLFVAFSQAEFKKVSETLQTTVRELMATKADRAELLEMHESRFGDADLIAKVSSPALVSFAIFNNCRFLPVISIQYL
jgi:hypothetical protein